MKKLYNNLKEEIIPLSKKQYLSLFLYIAVLFQFVLFFSPALAKNYEETEQERYVANLSAENIEENINLKEELIETSFPVHESLVELYDENKYNYICFHDIYFFVNVLLIIKMISYYYLFVNCLS